MERNGGGSAGFNQTDFFRPTDPSAAASKDPGELKERAARHQAAAGRESQASTVSTSVEEPFEKFDISAPVLPTAAEASREPESLRARLSQHRAEAQTEASRQPETVDPDLLEAFKAPRPVRLQKGPAEKSDAPNSEPVRPKEPSVAPTPVAPLSNREIYREMERNGLNQVSFPEYGGTPQARPPVPDSPAPPTPEPSPSPRPAPRPEPSPGPATPPSLHPSVEATYRRLGFDPYATAPPPAQASPKPAPARSPVQAPLRPWPGAELARPAPIYSGPADRWSPHPGTGRTSWSSFPAWLTMGAAMTAAFTLGAWIF